VSEREREVLALYVAGLTRKEIAAQLGIAASTVATYLDRIKEATGCTSRREMVALAVGDGLVTVQELPFWQRIARLAGVAR
jgi:DNA-binding CsgD family transcriptional regulator